MKGGKLRGDLSMVFDFEKNVYRACAKIPKGKVATYQDIAIMIGSPRAVRAVGNALNRNSHPSSRVPCHRVVRSDGSIGGFARGAREKAKLLRREGLIIRSNKIDLARSGIKRNSL
mgnify:CR=1 FL=1